MATNSPDIADPTVQAALDGITTDPEHGVPGLVFAAIERDGNVITTNVSGQRGKKTNHPMTLETVFWIASCSKLITAIACMQLVERSFLELDDHGQLYNLCPELKNIKVLNDKGNLVDREGHITLRMLLNHTAGFGYEFSNPRIKDYGRPIGFDSSQCNMDSFLNMPLANQPGSKWEYGVGVDWAGIALERATGTTLNDFMCRYIFEPLEIHSTNMFPNQDMKANLASMTRRYKDGQIRDRNHLYHRALIASVQEERTNCFNSGGGGLFSSPLDFLQVLSTLLNNGVSPKTGKQILKPETIGQMFENQIPQFPNFARHFIPAAKSEYTNPILQLFPQTDNPPQGWTLSGMQTIEPGITGRGRNTVWWAGLPNLYWWCDREEGVAGILAGQVMPFADSQIIETWIKCEKAVYDLRKGRKGGAKPDIDVMSRVRTCVGGISKL